MCCLFGILDYKQSLSAKQLNKMVAVLSKACEARGTDATGIAYNYNDKLCVFKRPLPAHKMKFRIPDRVHYVMGHTRMTTQGNEKFNYNNHPFLGKTLNTEFALAHNGVIHNDFHLQIAELEREYILQRQKEGIAVAKQNGVYRGRKPIVHPRFTEIVSLWQNVNITAVEAMKRLNMKPSTFYRKVKKSLYKQSLKLV